MDSFGEPIDGHPRFFSEEKRDVNGFPMNPNAREYPSDFIQTGISAIDGLTSPLEDKNFQSLAVQAFRTMNSPPKLLGKRKFVEPMKNFM